MWILSRKILEARQDPLANKFEKDVTVTDASNDPTSSFATEHIVKLSYFGRLLNFAMTGVNVDPDGTTTRTNIQVIPDSILVNQGAFQQDYATWDTPNNNPRQGSPMAHVWQAFGSSDNRIIWSMHRIPSTR